jgi:hypothetical protein
MNDLLHIGPSSSIVTPQPKFTNYKHNLWVGGNKAAIPDADGKNTHWGKVIGFEYQVPSGLSLKEARRQAVGLMERNRDRLEDEYGVEGAEAILTAFSAVIGGKMYTRPMTGLEVIQGEM